MRRPGSSDPGVAVREVDPQAADLVDDLRVRRRADERPDRFVAVGQATTDRQAEMAGCADDQDHYSLL